MEKVYEVCITYKTGTQFKFEVTKFNIENGKYTWAVAKRFKGFAPLLISPDEVESIYSRELE